MMRNAETILDIIRQRGQRGLPVMDAYRLLYQRDLYLRAYGKLYRNQDAMTPGSTSETVDGMSLEKIGIFHTSTKVVNSLSSSTTNMAHRRRNLSIGPPCPNLIP